MGNASSIMAVANSVVIPVFSVNLSLNTYRDGIKVVLQERKLCNLIESYECPPFA